LDESRIRTVLSVPVGTLSNVTPAPFTVRLSSIITVPKAESKVRFPVDVLISPAAVTPILTASKLAPAKVGEAVVLKS